MTAHAFPIEGPTICTRVLSPGNCPALSPARLAANRANAQLSTGAKTAEAKVHNNCATSAYLDHQFLNELKPFDELNPSAENIARFICQELQKDLQAGSIAYVRVWETDTWYAVYRP